MGSCIKTVSMKCLILLAAMSCVLGDAEPSADPQYYGTNPLMYGAGVPYHGYGSKLPYGYGYGLPSLGGHPVYGHHLANPSYAHPAYGAFENYNSVGWPFATTAVDKTD